MAITTGVYKSDSESLFYLNVYIGVVTWVGESSDGSGVHIYRGFKEGNNYKGKWFSVPKGVSTGSGDLIIEPTTNGFRVADFSGGYGHREFSEVTINPEDRNSSQQHVPGFEEAEQYCKNLTGSWLGDDDSTYYLNQVGDDVIWYGENKNLLSGPTSNLLSSVFFGKIDITDCGLVIKGNWHIVPKGGMTASGTLSVGVFGGGEMRLIESTTESINGAPIEEEMPGTFFEYPTNEWRRIHSKVIGINFKNIRVGNTQDGAIDDGDDVYLGFAVFVSDTEIADLRRPGGSRVNVEYRFGGIRENITISDGLIPIAPHKGGEFAVMFSQWAGEYPEYKKLSSHMGWGILGVESDWARDIRSEDTPSVYRRTGGGRWGIPPAAPAAPTTIFVPPAPGRTAGTSFSSNAVLSALAGQLEAQMKHGEPVSMDLVTVSRTARGWGASELIGAANRSWSWENLIPELGPRTATITDGDASWTVTLEVSVIRSERTAPLF